MMTPASRPIILITHLPLLTPRSGMYRLPCRSKSLSQMPMCASQFPPPTLTRGNNGHVLRITLCCPALMEYCSTALCHGAQRLSTPYVQAAGSACQCASSESGTRLSSPHFFPTPLGQDLPVNHTKRRRCSDPFPLLGQRPFSPVSLAFAPLLRL
ncbi:hypothetical protein BGZ63DRAFT_104393 [Mariannaea sp. PMI_226]|nr:hypothetical protein BGZ63DRAFT_104393 [Mariannaea sp. PMI_226]